MAHVYCRVGSIMCGHNYLKVQNWQFSMFLLLSYNSSYLRNSSTRSVYLCPLLKLEWQAKKKKSLRLMYPRCSSFDSVWRYWLCISVIWPWHSRRSTHILAFLLIFSGFQQMMTQRASTRPSIEWTRFILNCEPCTATLITSKNINIVLEMSTIDCLKSILFN